MRVRASIPAGYLMRLHRDRRDPIVLCDVGTPGLSAPLGDDRQVRFAARSLVGAQKQEATDSGMQLCL
ncbi:hypothetical protein CKAH01_05175 [Colletotrichum kahawae]|uniref:Uncharacterized protein n=1 Tax=Colletotrichum kahawae TaxID=34407 RepID=A0AAD9YDY2_COLKA|nr:hypothetical protein CKAH01_05175 [Colletotrichum kahawae]